MKPMLLDLFCGAGGCAMGYSRAGFRVVGVDVKPQKRYPFEFVLADALEFCRDHGGDFDVIHASPPCQAYTRASFTAGNRQRHPDLLGVTRQVLAETGKPWVIENVPGAPLQPPAVMLCGLMFGLKVFHHRFFESPVMFLLPERCSHKGHLIGLNGMRCPVGHGGWASQRERNKIKARAAGEKDDLKSWKIAMGIDWMTRNEMSQAIPPAFTHYLGKQLRRIIGH